MTPDASRMATQTHPQQATIGDHRRPGWILAFTQCLLHIWLQNGREFSGDSKSGSSRPPSQSRQKRPGSLVLITYISPLCAPSLLLRVSSLNTCSRRLTSELIKAPEIQRVGKWKNHQQVLWLWWDTWKRSTGGGGSSCCRESCIFILWYLTRIVL